MLTTDEVSVQRARAIAKVVSDLLVQHEVPGELTLTGGSSFPGLLTKGDIDLHLRVTASEFEDVVERLRGVADAAHPEIWTDTFATFERTQEPTVGIAVTVIGCAHDTRFTSGWAHLTEDVNLRAEYNALKRSAEYDEAKSSFFDRISAAPPR